MYKITRQGNTEQTYVIEAVCDNLTDITTLPINWEVGSTCIVIEDSSVWMLGNDKNWHKL